MKEDMKRARAGLLLALSMLVGGCKFQHQMDARFGDQDFKSAIALVELYKVRHGVYPKALGDIHYLGGWDPIYLRGVRYKRVGAGYELDIERGWVGKPTLSYPPGFWHGLGIVVSNVGGLQAARTRAPGTPGAARGASAATPRPDQAVR